MPAPTADANLRRESFRGLAFFLVTLAIVIFLPAWSVAYWQGWLYWLVFTASVVAITIHFLRRDPDLIRRRMPAGAAAETEPAQKAIQAVASVCFVAMYIVSGLDHRFGWSGIPAAVSVAADIVAAMGFAGVFLTFRENSFAAATIQVDTGQRVISTGPYAVVRHPMYASAGPMILATPIALDSWWGLIPAALLMAVIVARLVDEERFLAANLPGYAAYAARTRFRLVPAVW